MTDFLMTELDNYLHKNLEVADIILKRYRNLNRSGQPSPK